jgi:predicted O-methyltransferase YrrM
MNAVLDRILDTQTVTDGAVTLPLRHPDFPALPVAVDITEGRFLADIIRDVDPETTLEIGMAYGVSTLYICDALAALHHRVRHIAIDPFQSTQWRGIGLRNVREAGYGEIVDLREERSEFALPALVNDGLHLDFAFVDGWHTFDQVMVEFFYLDRLLRVGGVIAFDDADRRSVNRVMRYVINYPNYEVYRRPSSSHQSFAGALRRGLRHLPAANRIFRLDLLHRDWDLGILGSCVAIRKVSEHRRSSGWYRDF